MTHQNIGHIVVRLPSNRSNAESMTTITVHVRDSDIVRACHSNTVILDMNCNIGDEDNVSRGVTR